MELPLKYTLDEIKAIVDMLDNLYNDIEQGRVPKARYDKDGRANYDYWNEDKDYIDRYIWTDDAEFCITTDKESGKTYLSEYVVIVARDNEDENYYFTQDELYQMVGR